MLERPARRKGIANLARKVTLSEIRIGKRDPIPYALEADWLVGAAGFEPLHLRIKFAKTLSSGREKSNMRISSKVVVPPPCQKKSQAMTRPLSSGTRHVRP